MNQVHSNPIFIVGPSRSGTTLVQSVINASGSYFITRETHYFDDLRDRYSDKGNIGYGSADIKECEDYFLALSHRPYGHKGDPALGQMSRSELWGRARALGGQADAFFEAYCRMEAEGTGSSGWGEKTPRHVYRIAEMVEAFPDARFVCVVRDPRAVVASYKTWRYRGGFNFDNDSNHEEAMRADYERARRSYSLLLISMMWSSAIKAISAAEAVYGSERVHVLRYEHLVNEPNRVTKELAKWMGVQWSPQMLAVPFTNSSTAEFDREGGIRQSPSRKWEEMLAVTEVGVVQALCKDGMARCGYISRPGIHFKWRLLCECLTLPVSVLRGIRANRSRMARIGPYVWRRLPFARAPKGKRATRSALTANRA